MSLNRFFHEPRDCGLSYSILRIAFGITAVLWLVSLHPFLNLFFGSEGLCPPAHLALSSPLVVTIWWLGLAAALVVAAGFFYRPASVVTFVCLAFFFRTPCRPDNYGDQIFVSLAFLMMFCPSLNARTPSASPWLHKLLRLYAGTLYLFPLIRRFWGLHWWDGTASWIALADPSTSRVWELLSRDPFTVPAWVFFGITYASLAFEGLFPFLIWIRRLRLTLVIAGIVFHATMGIALDLGLFPLQMAVVLIGCLDDGSISSEPHASPTTPALHPRA